MRLRSARLAVLAQRVSVYDGSEDVSLGLWSDCDSVGDSVTVHDGPDAGAPALIRDTIQCCREIHVRDGKFHNTVLTAYWDTR